MQGQAKAAVMQDGIQEIANGQGKTDSNQDSAEERANANPYGDQNHTDVLIEDSVEVHSSCMLYRRDFLETCSKTDSEQCTVVEEECTN